MNDKKAWYSYAAEGIIKYNMQIPWGNWVYNSALSAKRRLGMRHYELYDHLGNVLTTVLDRKVGHAYDGGSTYNYYMPDVATAQDYYPFGMMMPGRTFINSNTAIRDYRFGFKGQEKDNEVKA